MSGTEEATVNPDGSTTFANGEGAEYNATENSTFYDEGMGTIYEEELPKIDPAIYLLIIFVIGVVITVVVYIKRQKNDDEFFTELDGEKFNLKLPAAVDEYYDIKDKCIDSGWEPGKKVDKAANGPHRVLAQALMKRCIADIPLVTHIQKESSGMNKLYSNSMVSIKQWKSYQAAENMVSIEVGEVREEADEIEPGWSQVIWRQAMQYHNMLKQRNESEAKQMAAQAAKKQAEENKVLVEKKKVDDKRARELAAEKAAADLIKMEEREKQSKTAFNGGMKKGFLSKSKK